MKKLIGLLGAAGFLIPSVAMAGAVNNNIGASAKRVTGSYGTKQVVNVDSTIHKNNTMYVAGANWGGSISADAENLSWGDRDMTYNYGRASAQAGFYQDADNWSNQAEFESEGQYGFEGGYEEDGHLTAHASQETDYNERRRDTSDTDYHENSGTIGGSRSWGGSETQTEGEFGYEEETEGGSVNGYTESSDTHTNGGGESSNHDVERTRDDSETVNGKLTHPKRDIENSRGTSVTRGRGSEEYDYSEDSDTHTEGGSIYGYGYGETANTETEGGYDYGEGTETHTEGGGGYGEIATTDSHETSVYGEGSRTSGGSDTEDWGETTGNIDTVATANVDAESHGYYGGGGGYEVEGSGEAEANGAITTAGTLDGATASSYGSGHEHFVDGAGTVNRDHHWNGYAGSLHENGTTTTGVVAENLESFTSRGFETTAFSGTNWD
jgi:hypothetical protein